MGKPALPLFDVGQVVMTPGAQALGIDFLPYLQKHLYGDWGDLDTHDRIANEMAVAQGDARILSAYQVKEDARIWIITEADRSATTILLPDEY